MSPNVIPIVFDALQQGVRELRALRFRERQHIIEEVASVGGHLRIIAARLVFGWGSSGPRAPSGRRA
jgi:ATP-dependent DNA ligase